MTLINQIVPSTSANVLKDFSGKEILSFVISMEAGDHKNREDFD